MLRKESFGKILLTAGILAMTGCAAHTPPAGESASQSSGAQPQDGGTIHAKYEGYSLLYRLMSDESDVNKILIIKDVDPALKAVVGQIAETCSNAKERFDEYQKQDGHSEFDVPDLPRVEQEARDLEAKMDEKELVFSSGKAFELRLILTQLQAMRYGQQLCNALVPIELDPQRKAVLSNLGSELGAYHDRLAEMIAPK
jgi:hypothetical protein